MPLLHPENELLQDSSDSGLLAGDPTAEIEQIVAEAEEFVRGFKQLAEKLNLPSTDRSFEALNHAQSMLAANCDTVRALAHFLKDHHYHMPADQRAAIGEVISSAERQIRKATLLLQLQIFRLDRVLDKIFGAELPGRTTGEDQARSLFPPTSASSEQTDSARAR